MCTMYKETLESLLFVLYHDASRTITKHTDRM